MGAVMVLSWLLGDEAGAVAGYGITRDF